jgi:hypothetical protein
MCTFYYQPLLFGSGEMLIRPANSRGFTTSAVGPPKYNNTPNTLLGTIESAGGYRHYPLNYLTRALNVIS